VIEFLDCVFNSCLKLPVCEIGCWMILSEPACEEQMAFPGSFAQASSFRLSQNTRRSPLSLREISPRRAGVAWAR